MEVMQRAVVKSRTLKPLPGEITDARIRDATLPLKVEAARRAIAACTDLPELLKLKDQAEGLAAAVRIMKTVAPEIVSQANRMAKEAILKMGELLLQYSNKPTALGSTSPLSGVKRMGEKKELELTGGKGRKAFVTPRGKVPSELRSVIKPLGIQPYEATAARRIALAPKEVIESLLVDDSAPKGIYSLSLMTPRVSKKGLQLHSDNLRAVLGGKMGRGLSNVVYILREVPVTAFSQLTPDERKVVKAKIADIMELLDEMDRRLKL